MGRKVEWFYVFVIALLGIMLFVSVKFFKGSSGSAVGIARNKDYNITSERSARIKTIHVVSGQQVKKGDTLVELVSNTIDIEISKLQNRIEVMKAEQTLKERMVESEIAFIHAEQGVKLEEINSQIEEIKTELKLNRELTGAVNTSEEQAGPLEVKLQSLLLQRKKHQEAIDLKTAEVRKENNLEQTQFSNEIKLLEKELQQMSEGRGNLTKVAGSDGVVENVYVKPGEEIDAYSPILTIAPEHPTTVVAYLIGERHANFSIGGAVEISAYGNKSLTCEGKIIGYGSVSELPKILQKSTAVTAFGREVYIEISANNQFANGQKVLIR